MISAFNIKYILHLSAISPISRVNVFVIFLVHDSIQETWVMYSHLDVKTDAHSDWLLPQRGEQTLESVS